MDSDVRRINLLFGAPIFKEHLADFKNELLSFEYYLKQYPHDYGMLILIHAFDVYAELLNNHTEDINNIQQIVEHEFRKGLEKFADLSILSDELLDIAKKYQSCEIIDDEKNKSIALLKESPARIIQFEHHFNQIMDRVDVKITLYVRDSLKAFMKRYNLAFDDMCKASLSSKGRLKHWLYDDVHEMDDPCSFWIPGYFQLVIERRNFTLESEKIMNIH